MISLLYKVAIIVLEKEKKKVQSKWPFFNALWTMKHTHTYRQE